MTSDGLRLLPFRGLRYAPDRVSDLAAVTSPPYDVVVRPDGLHHLETADPYNIVRLILPQAGDPAVRHRQAAATLARWQAEGVLAHDPVPALYVYEQRAGGVLQRGLIGALRLSTPEEGVVLPHEGVIAEVVEDRAALMRATAANLEPLLLSYRGGESGPGARGADGGDGGAGGDHAGGGDGGDGTHAVIERAVHRAPLLATTTEDGVAHRLWSITEPAELAAVSADLAHRRALIADGHHRWATYLRLRAEHAAAAARRAECGAGDGGTGAGPAGDSPWDYGLVLLVDTARYPLRVQPIHRVLPRLPLADALRAVAESGAFRVRTLRLPPSAALAELDRTPGNAYVLTNGGAECRLLDLPSPRLLDDVLDPRRPDAWRRLDATVLHAVLLDRVLRVPDRSASIGYLHDAEAAVGQAARLGGTAVLMRAVPEETVRDLAEQGITMPRKSTSFGPKPATGLVLRTLGDAPG